MTRWISLAKMKSDAKRACGFSEYIPNYFIMASIICLSIKVQFAQKSHVYQLPTNVY